MKKLLIIVGVFLSLSASAQSVDTVKGAIQIQPVVVNAMAKDTAYQLTWTAFGLTRDTTQGCNTYVQMFDRTGKKVLDFNCPIPAATVNKWGTDDSVIDDYILTMYGLRKR